MRKNLKDYMEEKNQRRIKTYNNLESFIEEYKNSDGRICTTGLRILLSLIKKKSFFNKLTFDEKKLVIGTLFDYDHPDGVNIRDFPVVDWEKCSVMLLAEIWGKEGSLESIFKEEK